MRLRIHHETSGHAVTVATVVRPKLTCYGRPM